MNSNFLTLTRRLVLLSLCFPPMATLGQSHEQAQQELLADISAAQQNLASTQQNISEARQSLAARLSSLERELEGLREQSAARRRAEDEKTLSLNSLQQRLREWRQQSAYQRNQLAGFFRLQAFDAGTAQQNPYAMLEQQARQALAALDPVWQEQDIANLSGALVGAETLSLGPLHWYLSDSGEAGLLETGAGIPRMSYAFDGQATEQLAQLHTAGYGLLAFDPTLTRAIELSRQRESLLGHVRQGGMWVVPILFFAAAALLVALVKSVQLWRLPKPAPELQSRLNEQQRSPLPAAERRGILLDIRAGLSGMQAELLDIALDTPLGQVRDDLLLSQLNRQRRQLEQWLGAIAVIAAIAPLLGLLGTVSGMIETFKLMTLFGAGDAQAVSSGISKALITTELGLIVAIPSLLLHAILSRRIRHYCNELEANAIQFSQLATGAPQ